MNSRRRCSTGSPPLPDLLSAIAESGAFKVAHPTRKNVYLVLNLPRKLGQRAAVWIAGESRGTRFERRGTAESWAGEFNGIVVSITEGKS